MIIPNYFLQKASRQFGDAGPQWVRELPSLFALCQDKWGLTDCVPADGLSINLVCYARSEVHGDVVLKIAGPHGERYTEMPALRLYGGRRACRCLDVDEGASAMLLERLVPGHNLRTLEKREQLEIGTELVASLPVPVTESHGLPHYRDWVARAVETTRIRFDPDARLRALLSAMERTFGEICLRDSLRYLLHGDLHHENMLLGRGGIWKAIDPQGVIGPPYFESARFLENHVIEHGAGIRLTQLDTSVRYVAKRLGESARVIAGALFVLHTLSTCWGLEMGYTRERVARQVGECEKLLEFANGLG